MTSNTLCINIRESSLCLPNAWRDSLKLRCPVCGDDYIHLGAPSFKVSGRDAYGSNLGPRGDAIVIPARCESKEHDFAILIAEHKGQVFIWQKTGEPQKVDTVIWKGGDS